MVVFLFFQSAELPEFTVCISNKRVCIAGGILSVCVCQTDSQTEKDEDVQCHQHPTLSISDDFIQPVSQSDALINKWTDLMSATPFI